MPISTSTIVTRDLYLSFYRLVLRRRSFRRMIPLIYLALFFVLVFLMTNLSTPEGQSPFLPLLKELCIFLLILAGAFFLIYVVSPRIAYRRSAQSFSKPMRIVFSPDGFQAFAEVNGIESTARVPYTSLESVIETVGAFYLFIDKRRAHVVGKDSFTEGTPDDLRLLLWNQLGPKKYQTR